MNGTSTRASAATRRFEGLADGSASGWAGIVAGAVYLSAQMLFVTVIRQESPWVPLQRISALLLGPDVLPPPADISLSIAGFALLLHFALAFWYGRLIGLAVQRVPGALGWVVGAGCGLALYALNFHAIGPFLFPWFAESQGGVTLFDHVLFGAVAALTFLVLRRKTVPAGGDSALG